MDLHISAAGILVPGFAAQVLPLFAIGMVGQTGVFIDGKNFTRP